MARDRLAAMRVSSIVNGTGGGVYLVLKGIKGSQGKGYEILSLGLEPVHSIEYLIYY